MKWIGQHIWDLTSRFRNDVYLEGLAETAETRGLVVDANGKVSINPLSGDEHATHIYENVRNDEGATIPVGTPVYSKGEIGGSERIKVGIAKASDPNRMPAIGITNTELTATGDTKDGLITLVGVYNTNLSGFSGVSENDIVYVAVGGGLTITKPTGANLIQNIGIVLKTNGPGTIIQGLQVTCIGRTNDVPTPLYIDHANQRVGIGATSPGYKLEVNGTGSFFGNIRSGGGTLWSDSNGGVQLGYNSSNATGYLTTYYDSTSVVIGAGISQKTGITINGQSASAGNQITFRVGNSDRVHIDSSGNVGIGTTSPAQKLHVVGDARIQGNLTVNGTYTQIDTDVNTTEQWLVTNDGTGPAAVINQLGTEDIFDVQDDGTSVFYIEDGGNIGIGTTSPDAKLSVTSTTLNSEDIVYLKSGADNVDDYLGIAWELNIGGNGPHAAIRAVGGPSSGDCRLGLFTTSDGSTLTEGLSVAHNGKVGIGTTSPAETLDVVGYAKASTGFKAGNYTILSESGNETSLSNSAYYPMFFKTNNQKRMTISNAGNVGIGTTSPSEKLEVDGNIVVNGSSDSSDGLHLKDRTFIAFSDASSVVSRFRSSASGIFQFQDGSFNTGVELRTNGNSYFNGGNVGIGTTSPDGKLDVAGNTDARVILGRAKFESYVSDYFYLSHFDQGSSTNYALNQSPTGSTSINAPTGQNVTLKINNSAKLQVQGATGNVGIGTTSPSEKLEVTGNIKLNTGGYIVGDSTAVYLRLSNSLGSTLGYSTGTIKVAPSFTYNNASGEQFRINHADGNVGIGTNNPSEKLEVNGNISIGDSNELKIGASDDLRLYHDGSDSYLRAYGAADLIIMHDQADRDIKFKADNGSGGVAEYLRIDGGVGYMIASKAIRALDSVNFQLGTSADFTMQHNGVNTILQNFNGNLEITQGADDGDIIFQSDDGSGGVTEYLRIDGGEGRLVHTANSRYLDSVMAMFGTGADLQVYHDGSHSHVVNLTGNLRIRNFADNSDITFESDDGSGGTTEYFKVDGGTERTIFKQNTSHDDGVMALFGNDLDLRVYHDGADSFIKSDGTGNLYLQQLNNDKDIIFQSDDGSGGVTTYFFLDGGSVATQFNKNTLHPDGIKARFGSSADMYINHDGTNSYIENETGNLYILNRSDDKDIVFQSDDGSGGLATYLTIDGSNGYTVATKQIRFNDNVTAKFGSAGDLSIYHNGTDSVIDNYVGDFYISQKAADKDLIFRADDGAGGFETYFFLDGSGNSGNNPRTVFPDNSSIVIGTGNDLFLKHTGTNSEIFNFTGDLIIGNHANDKDIVFQSDDGSGGVTEYFRVDGGLVKSVFSKNLMLLDSVKAQFGDSNDLEIYHDGSNNYIQGVNGDLYIQNGSNDKDIILRSDDGSGGQTEYFRLDGGLGYSVAEKSIRMADGQSFFVGTGLDGYVSHSGTNMLIANEVGDFVIKNNANDGDIMFQSDNGSGGVTNYFKLWGAVESLAVYKDMLFVYDGDGGKLKFGASQDLQIYHNGTNSNIENFNGTLQIVQNADDGNITFRSDDGSGGTTEYFRLDGALGYTRFWKHARLEDNVELRVGTGNDLRFTHTGTGSYIDNYTGNLSIRNFADDSDILFQSDDGLGGVETYFFLDGSEGVVNFPDNKRLTFGTGRDLFLYHDGTNATFKNYVGDIVIQNEANDKDIRFKSDDGSGGIAEYFRVDGSSQITIFSKATSYGDNVKALFGASSDLQIYHDGSHSYIKDTGTGNLRIDASDFYVRNSGGTKIAIDALDSAEVALRYDGSRKLETTSTGVEVTGNISLTGSVQKQIQVFPMNFVDDLGTDKHFMPFVTNTEQTVVYQEEAAMVMPADGRVVSVTVHYAQMDGADGNITVGIETSACGQSYANPWTVEETETIAASVADDHHVFHFAFDNAKHFESTNKMAISIQQSTDMQSAARFFWVTAVIEYDWSTFLGGTSAEYTTTP